MTAPCRDARSERPLLNDLDDVTFDGDGRTDRASLHGNVSLYYNGRPLAKHDRASLQRVIRIIVTRHWLLVSLYYNGRSDRASLQGAVTASI